MALLCQATVAALHGKTAASFTYNPFVSVERADGRNSGLHLNFITLDLPVSETEGYMPHGNYDVPSTAALPILLPPS